MRRIFFLTAVAACGGSAATGPTPKAPDPDANLDPAASRAAVEKLVHEQYDALARGDSDAFLKHADPDGFMMGIVHSRRTPEFLVELHKAIDPIVKRGAKFKVDSGGLQIGVSPDGHAAWVTDELSFTITMGAHDMGMKQRFTEILAEKGGSWSILADHMSAMNESHDGGEPEAVPDQLGPGAEQIPARLDALLADPSSFIESFADRADTTFVGPGPDQLFVGAPAVKQFLQHIKTMQVTIARQGAMRAGVAFGGQLAWGACNVHFSFTFPDGKKYDVTDRLLIAFLKDGDIWKVVQAHFSVVPKEMG